MREEGASTSRLVPSVSGWGCSAGRYAPRDPSELGGSRSFPYENELGWALAGCPNPRAIAGPPPPLPPPRLNMRRVMTRTGRTAPLQTQSTSHQGVCVRLSAPENRTDGTAARPSRSAVPHHVLQAPRGGCVLTPPHG